jgi:hypothetical protein
MKKQLTFKIEKTKEELMEYAREYKIRKYTITPWSSDDGYTGFVMWYRTHVSMERA